MSTNINVRGATSFTGTVESEYGDPLSGASIVLVDSYFNILGSTTTNSQGDYSLSVTLNGNSPYYLSVAKNYRWDTDTKIVYSGGTNDFELDAITEKIAVFFYAYDACNDDTIDIYEEILDDEGYTKYFRFANSDDVSDDCDTVDDYERPADTLFCYIMGHGEYDSSEGESYTYFKSNENSQVYSDTFKSYMDNWDSARKCLLVDSCYSGTWATDFTASPYLAMSSADTANEADFRSGYPDQEGEFSYYFFDAVYAGDTAVEAWEAAEDECSDQNPEKSDYSSYTWFN